MPTFMCFLNWTDQAAKALKDAPKRYEATKALVTRLGGRLVCAYVTTGQYDVALVVEMPNGDDDTVGRRDNVVGECADDNRPGVHSRGVWKTRRRSAYDDITLAVKPVGVRRRAGFLVLARALTFVHLSNHLVRSAWMRCR